MKKRIPLSLATLLLVLLPGCIVDASDNGSSVQSTQFVFSMSDAAINGDVASVQYDVPAITPEVVDHGAILAYFRDQGTWTAMPFTFADESPDLPAVDYTITLGYAYDDYLFEAFYEASTPEAPIDSQPDRPIKLVILEDLNFARLNNIDLSDYEAVQQAYNLK